MNPPCPPTEEGSQSLLSSLLGEVGSYQAVLSPIVFFFCGTCTVAKITHLARVLGRKNDEPCGAKFLLCARLLRRH